MSTTAIEKATTTERIIGITVTYTVTRIQALLSVAKIVLPHRNNRMLGIRNSTAVPPTTAGIA
jgi:hypothetical protein